VARHRFPCDDGIANLAGRLARAGRIVPTSVNRKKGRTMIYELRIYRCIPGRLPALLKRFEATTVELWKRHAIRPVGFWTTLIGESNQDLTYLLAWESLAEREQKWAAFQSDPEWISRRAESERDGQIIANIASQLLVPTAFSALK
jgi:hypothetical protein